MEEVPGNMSKHLRGNKCLYQPFFVIYDFETIIIKTEDHSKLEELTYPYGSNTSFLKHFDGSNWKKYIKSLIKMINFKDVTRKNIKNTIQVDPQFLTTHTVY